MAVDADLRFKGVSNNPLQHAPDKLIVADIFSMNAFIKLGYPKKKINLVESPSLKRIQLLLEDYKKTSKSNLRQDLLGLDPSPKEIWLFAAEHDTGDNSNYEYTLHGRGETKSRVKIVLEEVLEVSKLIKPKPFIILRLHPKNNKNEFINYLDEIDLLSYDTDAFPYIIASDLVIGLSSIILLEAAFAGRATLSIVPRLEECQWSPSVLQKLTPCATTRSAIYEKIKNKYASKTTEINNNYLPSLLEIITTSLK